jgi:hypothetical protein
MLWAYNFAAAIDGIRPTNPILSAKKNCESFA